MYEYRALVLAVVDADTLRLEVDLGLDIRHRLTVRLAGVDAPELATDAGKAALQFTRSWLAAHALVPGVHATENAFELIVRTHKDKREKYGRYLADVFAGEHCLNLDLVNAGHARPYDGGPRTSVAGG